MTKKLKIYLDTSVINFLFADDAPEKKEITVDFFENYLDKYDVYISEYVVKEMLKTQNRQKLDLLLGAISAYKISVYEEANNDIIELAKAYLENKILPINMLMMLCMLLTASFLSSIFYCHGILSIWQISTNKIKSIR